LSSRVVMLVDLDYFFAQAEEIRNPAIRDKPVVVCVYSGRSEDSGAVSTSNYIARGYGVKSGMPIIQAKRKLENIEAVFLPVDHVYYDQVSKKVMDVLRSYADGFEQVGVDEAFVEETKSTEGDFEKARSLAQAIKDKVRAQLGLSCSIGVGPNKLVSKVAADEEKPNGLTIIKPEEVEHFLFPLPVRRLIGVGVKTEERMRDMGINTIGDLAKFDVQRLIDIFGKKLGTYFHNAAQGLDDDPVEEKGEAESFSRIATLKQDSHDLALVLEKADQLCEEIHITLVQQKLSFKTVGIVAFMKDLTVYSRSKTLENQTNAIEIMRQTVKELYAKLLSEVQFDVRRVGVKVSGFAREQKGQKRLTSFLDSAQDSQS
jgi:DNA polymerase IV (DinB-like DNA polymerase)